WVGPCQLDGKDAFVLLRLQRNAGRATGLAYSPPLGMRTPVSDVEVDGNRLALSFQTPEGTVRLTCDIRGDKLEGTAEYRGSKGGCAFRRRQPMDAASFDAFRGDYQLAPDHVVFIGRFNTARYLFLSDGNLRVEIMPVGPREFLADDLRTITFEIDEGGRVAAAIVSESGQKPQRAPRVRLYTEEAVTFSNGDVRLAGTLTVPPGPGPHPAVVFVHGSGPQTRASYAVEVDRLARHGIASLAFDKRGTGESAGDWHLADFDVLAEDVLAGVQLLRRHPRIRPDKVGLLGGSQAGWVIPLAASRCEDIAFIVLFSGGAVMPA